MPSSTRTTKRRRTAAAIVVFVLLSAAAELGFRATGRHYRFPTPCTWHPAVGCILDPNLDEAYAAGTATFRLITNADGRRDRPRGPKTAGTRRVLVLGDSVGFGILVDAERTFPALLESRLAGRHVDVIDGASPYLRGTEQQLSYFLDYGAALRPDLVLLVFAAQNDFLDNAHQYFWRPGAAGLERTSQANPPLLHRLVLATEKWRAVRWLSRHSYVFGAFEWVYWNIGHLPPPDRSVDPALATERAIARLREEVTRRGANLAVILQPASRSVRALRATGSFPDGADEPRLLAIAGRLAIPVLDLTPAIREDPSLVLGNGHLSAKGHAQLAATLASNIDRWLPGPAATPGLLGTADGDVVEPAARLQPDVR